MCVRPRSRDCKNRSASARRRSAISRPVCRRCCSTSRRPISTSRRRPRIDRSLGGLCCGAGRKATRRHLAKHPECPAFVLHQSARAAHDSPRPCLNRPRASAAERVPLAFHLGRVARRAATAGDRRRTDGRLHGDVCVLGSDGHCHGDEASSFTLALVRPLCAGDPRQRPPTTKWITWRLMPSGSLRSYCRGRTTTSSIRRIRCRSFSTCAARRSAPTDFAPTPT